MLTAPIPNDELQRLNAVHRLLILDSDPEERFDRITQIVHHLFDIPSVFITLVDSDRVWFKSMYGCDVREEPRDVSFCGHTINNIVTESYSSRIFEVQNAEQDDRFYDNSFIIDKCKVRYYMGFVLQSKDLRNIGTLCMTDKRPRVFSEIQKKQFANLGFMAEAEITRSQIEFDSEMLKFPQYLNNASVDSYAHANMLLNMTTRLELIQKRINKTLKRYNANYKEWCILNEIAKTELSSPHMISKSLNISTPLLSNKLRTLEKKRLIERMHSAEGDRRVIHLICSEKGWQVWRVGMEEANHLGKLYLEDITSNNPS